METVDKIKCRVKRDLRYKNTIVGDKAYASKEVERKLNEGGFRLLTPPKKRSKNQYRSATECTALHERCKIEHLFGALKQTTRFRLRYDTFKRSFMEMLFMKMICYFSKKML